MHTGVVHFEIPAENVSRAKMFYKQVFGWKTNEYPDMEYTVFHTGPTDEEGMIKESGFINGGMMKRTSDIKNPIITINVDNIDTAVKKIKREGGEIIRGKTEVGEMGFTAYFKDPEGNVLSLWQNME
jgi:predicted enzyme related to lactoylglutathione lyase